MRDRRARSPGRRKIDAVLRHAVMRDRLTGLLKDEQNLIFVLDSEVERSSKYGYEFSLVFLDINHFKSINDTYGHPLGSKIISDLGHIIEGACRKIDFPFRYGGDEFAVVLPQTGQNAGIAWTERLLTRVRDLSWKGVNDAVVRVTISAGLASFPTHADSREEVLSLADEAMYSVKKKGLGGVGHP